jgi:alpha-D-ribose 1-methylphosphonate 5-triphosphate synthase subunit PhnG
MLHVRDRVPPDRREWLAILAKAPEGMLERWLALAGEVPTPTWLRQPETGLVMVRGRIGGAGERFNLGEMTVTRCTLRFETGQVGVAYVRGRAPRKAEIAALADALLQSPRWFETVQRDLIAPARTHLERERARKQRRTQATRVDFFTLARETGE